MKKALILLACTLTVFLVPAFAQINSLPFDKSNCARFEHAVQRITVFDQRPAKEEIMGWMKVNYTTAPVVYQTGRLFKVKDLGPVMDEPLKAIL